MANLSGNDWTHRDNNINRAMRKQGTSYFFGFEAIRPATVTIYNVSTTDANWTAIATGLTGVLSWKFTDENGNAFNYAFEAAPATYMTSYGDLQRDTAITALYVQRRGTTNVVGQLEVWTA